MRYFDYLIEKACDTLQIGSAALELCLTAQSVDDVHCHFVYDNNILRISSIEDNIKNQLIDILRKSKIEESNIKDKCLIVLNKIIIELLTEDSTYTVEENKTVALFNKCIDAKYGIKSLNIP